ncbi:hypothetical protein FKM82_019810 [Ascaphus truei]
MLRHTHMYTCLRTHTHMYTHLHMLTHAYTHVHMLMRTHTHSYTHVHMLMRTHTYTCTYAYARIHSCTHADAYTHLTALSNPRTASGRTHALEHSQNSSRGRCMRFVPLPFNSLRSESKGLNLP